jgi:hypothetical protein
VNGVEVVVARYCEDLSWLQVLPGPWRTTVYDKSRGGPRQTVETHWYKSPGGPDFGEPWPGAVELPNRGAEAHTYLHHISAKWDALADVTLFMQGDPRQFVDDVRLEYGNVVARAYQEGFAAVGPFLDCDDEGRPHHDKPLVELRDMWGAFKGGHVPKKLNWHASAQFAVTRDRLRESFPREAYVMAMDACSTKLHACAMERLWWELLASKRRRGNA